MSNVPKYNGEIFHGEAVVTPGRCIQEHGGQLGLQVNRHIHYQSQQVLYFLILLVYTSFRLK